MELQVYIVVQWVEKIFVRGSVAIANSLSPGTGCEEGQSFSKSLPCDFCALVTPVFHKALAKCSRQHSQKPRTAD